MHNRRLQLFYINFVSRITSFISLNSGCELIDWLIANEAEWILDRDVAKVVGQTLIDLKVIRHLQPEITLMIDGKHVYQFLVESFILFFY